jgi:hypothetical protein
LKLVGLDDAAVDKLLLSLAPILKGKWLGVPLREVIGERVKDKIAASKRNGIWVGTMETKDALLVSNVSTSL